MSDLFLHGAAIYQIYFTIYYIWNIQASNFSSVPYLKGFGTSKLEFETFESY